MTEADLILKELRVHGIKGRVTMGGKHPRVYFAVAGIERFVVCAGTSSDRRAGIAAITRIRRMLGVSGTRPKSHRPKSRRVRRVDVPALPSVFTIKPDPFAKLLSAPAVAAALPMLADMAWRGMWRDICVERFGAPSVAASVGLR